jgi:hypothetical protein
MDGGFIDFGAQKRKRWNRAEKVKMLHRYNVVDGRVPLPILTL